MSDAVTLDPVSLKFWQDNNLEWKRFEYDLKPKDYVIDIGSYLKEWARVIEERYHCKVDCFDALDNRAAWIKDGHIFLGGAYYYTSAFLPDQQAYRCEDVCKYINRHVRLMKINIEGGEYTLIDYIIKMGCINNIQELQVQFHLIEGEDNRKNYEELAKRLSLTHKITWQYPFCWENWIRK